MRLSWRTSPGWLHPSCGSFDQTGPGGLQSLTPGVVGQHLVERRRSLWDVDLDGTSAQAADGRAVEAEDRTRDVERGQAPRHLDQARVQARRVFAHVDAV